MAQYPGKAKGADAIYSKHAVQWRGVVRKEHRAAVSRAPPQALPAKRQLPIPDVHSHVSIKRPKPADARNWRRGCIGRKPVRGTDKAKHRLRRRWSGR